MATPRHMLASVLIALLCLQAWPAKAEDPEGGLKALAPSPAETTAAPAIDFGKSEGKAVKLLKESMYKLIDAQQQQPVLAGFGLVFGLASIIDGYRFFQMLVLTSVVAVSFCFIMSQLEDTWPGQVGEITKTVASAEFAFFAGLAAYLGWEGTQLVLGLAVGVYLFHVTEEVSTVLFKTPTLPHHCIWVTAGFTLMVLLGSWLVNEKGGGGRVLAILSPLFGASLVVATSGYFFVLGTTTPGMAKSLHVNITRSEVPSVLDFWYMMVYPLSSKTVGFFTLTHGNISIGKYTLELDRILCIFFWILLFFVGSYAQCKSLSKRKVANAREGEKTVTGLGAWLLRNNAEAEIPM